MMQKTNKARMKVLDLEVQAKGVGQSLHGNMLVKAEGRKNSSYMCEHAIFSV